jgi:antitoxin component YwqK of YwqJK toxin-antitoxin module
MKKIALTLLGISLMLISLAQNDLTDKSLYNNTYAPEVVIDKKYGITMYEPLNMMLGNDTVRNDANGYAANGYMEDYYTTGQLMHKGFYVDGELKIYKNYFPNGNVERNFRMVDLKKSKMTIYYEDATVRSEIVYVGTEALKWEDYYPNGTVEFVEEYNKSFEYYIFKANYFENGSPENTLELTDKKKLIYTQTYYHSNGKIKEQGEMLYNKALFDYERKGTWHIFDENGKPTKDVKYASGKIQSEKDL